MKKLNPRNYRVDDLPFREHTQRYNLKDSAREERIKAHCERVKRENKDDKPIKTGCAIPDTNLKIIEEIEGLINQVNDKLAIIDVEWEPEIATRKYYIGIAFEEIDLFQKTTLFELKRAFGGKVYGLCEDEGV